MSRSFFKAIILVGILSLTTTLAYSSLAARISGNQKQFTITESAQPVIFETNDHNQIICSSTNGFDEGSVLSATDGAHFFVYEYNNDEPPFSGDFVFSSSMLRSQPSLSRRNTLTTITSGKVYYARTDRDLIFDCNTGKLETIFECGNGVEEDEQIHPHLNLDHPSEDCDDGNTDNGDGCSSTCNIEAQTVSACGDGKIDQGETCDDGNTDIYDGCDDSCNREIGWVCAGEPSVCEMLIPM